MLDTTTDAGARADRRLGEEEILWFTTVRSDGQPQSVPVWFLWDGEMFLIYSQPDRQKLKNIGGNSRVGLHLDANTSARRRRGSGRGHSRDPGEVQDRHRPHRLRSRRFRADLLGGAPGDARPLASLVERSRDAGFVSSWRVEDRE
jgi:Pyridoxamine 5'-phosphate oxidase